MNDKKEYQKTYKRNVLKEIIKQTQPQWIYQTEEMPNEQIEEQYTQANFDNLSYNRFVIKDKIELAKEDRIQAIHLDIKNTSGKCTEKIFEGIFIIKILSKNWDNLQITKKDIKKIIKMEKQEKEEYSELITLNQQNNKEIAETILQELIDFYQKYQIIIEITIKQNKIYARAKIKELLQLTKNNQEEKIKIYSHIYIMNQIIEKTIRIDDMIQNKKSKAT